MAQCPTSVSISANTGATICAGTSVTFTATPTGGTNLAYDWFIGTTSQSATGNTFTSSSLNNLDKIKVVVTSSDDTSCSKESTILTMTVNPIRTPGVTISVPKQTICAGEDLTFTATPTNGGNSPSYQWQINGGNVGTNSSTLSTSTQSITLNNNDKVTVIMTSNVTCPDPANNPKTSNELTITVNPTLVPSVSITESNNNICPGDNITFTAIPINGGTPSYQWKTDGTNVGTNSSTFSSTTLTDNQVVTVVMTSTATCASPTIATSNPVTIDVKPTIPAPPSAITGSTQVCPGTVVTYSVTQVAGVKYNWTLPTGWSGASTTNSIDVTIGDYGENGSISVTAEDATDGSCGASNSKTLAISVKPGTPAVPTIITSTLDICPNTTNTYTVANDIFATRYEWTLPSGWTGSSNSTSINATSNSSGGDIKVKAINDCGESAEKIIAITIKPGIPTAPSAITRADQPNPICSGDSKNFSVTNDPNVSYNWSVPVGWSITNGNNSNAITVTAGNYGQNGTVTVTATNSCGTGTPSNLNVNIDPPAPTTVGPISGDALVCSTKTGLNYSVTGQTTATGYTWTVPTNWVITSGNNTNNITVNASSTPGNITVTADNSCGSSPPSSFSVGVTSSIPTQPLAITSSLDGNKNICPPANGITFSVPAVTGAASYLWTLPTAGWEITAGAGTRNITVKVTSAAAIGTQQVSVQAVNICGNSTASVYTGIEVANHIVTNAGADMTVCKTTNFAPITINASVLFGNSKFDPTFQTSGTGTFPSPSPKNESGPFTYQYKPTAADHAAGKVTITMTIPRPNGSNQNCGTGGGNNGVDDMVITFKPDPTASISGATTICTGNATDITFTASPNSVVTYNINGGANKTIPVGPNGTAVLATGNLTANTNYNLISVAYTGTLSCPKNITGTATVSITNPPTASISYAQPFCNSNSTSQTVTKTGTGNGNYSGTVGLTIDTSSGAILPNTSTPGIHTVTLTIPASGGCPEYTTTANVQIIDKVQITSPPQNVQVCEGQQAQFGVSASGENLTYQWYKGAVGSGAAISGATSTSYTINTTTLTNNGDYYITVTGTSPCSSENAPFSLTIDEKIIISSQPADQEVCENGSVTLDVTASSGTNPLTYQWYKGTPGTGTLLNGKTNDNLTISPALPADAGSYYVEIDASGTYNCSPVTSQVASLTIKEILTVEMSSKETQLCEGGNTQLNFINGTPNSVVTYSKDGVNQPGITINASGQGNVNTGGLISAGTTSKNYIYQLVQVEYLNPPPCTIDLSTIPPVSITVNANPSVDIGYNGIAEFCNSDNAVYAITTSNESGDWENGTYIVNPAMTIDPNTGSFSPGNIPAGTYTITYTTPANGGCSATSSSIDITIHDNVEISTQPSNLGICSSQSASFSVIATGSNLTYQWFKDGAPIAGATSADLYYNNATSIDAGSYYVEISGSSPCSKQTSETVTLNVDEDIVIIEPAANVEICANSLDPVVFKFVAHANGEPLNFEWYKEANPNDLLQSNSGNITIVETSDDPQAGYYSGTLTISGITMANKDQYEGVYYVKIIGPTHFTCPDAISKTFSLSILEVPALPVTMDLTYCTGDTAPALTATGNNLLWYTTDISADGTSTAPTPNTSIESSTTYWVSQKPGNCESERTPLTVTVNLKPEPPTGETDIHYCQGATVNPFDISGSNLTWYSDAGLQNVISEPVINSAVVGSNSYWVTQTEIYTENSCSSESLNVNVTVHTLPVIVLTSQFETICSGNSTQLYASGAFTYEWFDEANNSLGTSDTKSVSPTSTTTYKVVGFDTDNRCFSENTITINVDEPSKGGTLAGATAVCASGNSGTLSLSGSVGQIVRWESSVNNWSTKTEIANTTETLIFTNLIQNTKYRAVVKNGVCTEALSVEAIITVDPVPVGGKLLFSNNERIYLTCESPTTTSLSAITLSLHSGTVVNWKYRKSSASTWTIIPNTTTTLSAAQIHALGVTETMVFQVEISSGACTPNALSQTAILSVIPSDIEPTPVRIDPDVLCFGDEVTLTSSTGYTDRPNFLDQGAFDNASITNHGWRVRRNGNTTDLGFDTDANNTRPDRWKRATRHQFTTANINSPFTTREDLYISSGGASASGNKGFAVVSSNNSATMETPVFAIGGLDQAILTWDQMYNLTPGASIKVEISTDGGNTYNNILYSASTPPNPPNTTGISSGNYDGFALGTIASRPNNKMKVDLGYYMGQQNLRIRFHYTGVRLGDVWAIDNIDIPDGPRGVELVWYDYTDPDNPIYIGNSETETWSPTKIGYNEFEVRTKLLLDSGGTSCQSIENYERVTAFAFDQYISTTTVITGTCGTTEAQLSGVVEGTGTLNNGPAQGIITSFPTLDGYTAAWTVVGPSGYTVSESHFTSTSDPAISPPSTDPNAIFNPGIQGSFTLTWTLTSNEFILDNEGNNFPVPVNDGCPPTYVTADLSTLDCTTLDFDGVDDYVDLGLTYTGNYSIEAWIRPEASTGTIISSPSFEIKMADLPTLSLGARWYHVAVSNGNLYVDGILIGSSGTGNGGSRALIGARWNNTNGKAENHFSGWIEEVRIWNTALTQKQIRFMMNQRLKVDAAGTVLSPLQGEVVPNLVIQDGGLSSYYNDGTFNLDQDGIPFYDLTTSNLIGYYRLISDIPDLAGLVTFPANQQPSNGTTPDLSNNKIAGRLYNMTTDQENTSPTPYFSRGNGTWADPNTWARPNVWDFPNSPGYNNTPIDWNIARTNHDITSGNKDIIMLGLLSESGLTTIEADHPIRITHYLLLNGKMDLVGESQLLQDHGSILDNASIGYLDRNQQGKRNSFVYNYWSSPVSTTGSDNNGGYTVGSVLKDGTTPSSPGTISFRPGYWEADGAITSPIIISTYWLWKYSPAEANIYANWIQILENGPLNTGEGYTMKGTNGSAGIDEEQNYTFRGKPHNGDITLSEIDADENYLIGNPYPSAIDAYAFIDDNINIFNGALYFWDHFKIVDHILLRYVGGYATLTKGGAVPAASLDDRINNDPDPYGIFFKSEKFPKQYIPVGQGFLINSTDASGGKVKFSNSQRIYEKESSGNSLFLKPEIVTKSGRSSSENFTKIRLSLRSPIGYNRQILVGAIPTTTDGFDLGYDAHLFDDNVEDMYWLQGNNKLVIQSIADFNKDRVIPLGIRIKENKEFRIRLDTLENGNEEMNIYLNDKLNDSIHDLRKSAYFSTSEPGYIHDRFEIIFFKEEPPVIEGPIVGEPGDEGPIIEDPQTDFTTLSIKHAHNLREIQILNPDRLIITSVYLFDLNGNLIEDYTNIPHNQEINLRVRNYSSGVYLLKVYAEGKIISKKIIISN
jgi:hypothetical protein